MHVLTNERSECLNLKCLNFADEQRDMEILLMLYSIESFMRMFDEFCGDKSHNSLSLQNGS